MRNVYVYDHHDGWEDLMFVTDHELSDIDRFCWYCEEWDQLIAVVNTREDMIKILNEHSIFENEGYYTEIYQTLMEKFDEYSSDDYVQPVIPKDELEVGLFFFPEGNFSFAGCKLSEAETYGDFLIFPESHLDVWNKYKYLKYKDLKQEVDYDYYPRGRIVYAKENNVETEFDGTDLYMITDIAAWKVAYGYHFDWFKLLHCPFDGQPLTMEEAKSAHYHVQVDVPRNQSPYKHLQYIVKHDAAKKIEQVDYKKLPQKTKKQKKYYRQAKNRARRQSVSRVFDIFAELEAKGEFAKVSFG